MPFSTDEAPHPDSTGMDRQARRTSPPADPLARHPKLSACLLLVLALGTFVASMLGEVDPGLPPAALGWRFGLVLVRAAVAFAIIAVLALLVVRGWSGLWPRRLSRDGLDYPDTPADPDLQQVPPPAHCPPPSNQRQSGPWPTPTA